MEQLEKAAQVLLAPPNVVDSKQRHEAEQVFLHLRNTKNPFNLCRQLLENSESSYLHFEAAVLLKVGLIREWRELSQEDTLKLRQYLIHYVISHSNLPHFVRESLIQVIGIMVKRCGIDDQDDRGRLLGEIEQLVSSSDNHMRLIGCSILSAILQEYAVTVKSTDVGLTWEVHFRAKKQFESTDLKRIFHFIVKLLSELDKVNGELNQEMYSLLYKLITISESTLTWSFISLHLPKRIMSVFEQEQNPSLRPGSQWESTFLEFPVVQVFFKLYWRVRDKQDLGLHTLNCLVQLASLNGAVFSDRPTRLKYLMQYNECLFSLLSSIDVQESEAVGISNIFRKLVLHFPPPVLISLPEWMLVQLIDYLTTLTCKFSEKAAIEELGESEDQIYMEAFEQMLQSCASILQENNIYRTNQIKQSACLIFDTYLRCHMSPPYGTRVSVSVKEITEIELSDKVVYRDQLLLIGLCGRQDMDHALPLLTTLLEERISQLHKHLGSAISDNSDLINSPVLDNLFEDLHWLLLIIGNVMAMFSDGETPLIPLEIVSHSISVASMVNTEATMRLLASPAQMPNDIPDSNSADPVVRLLSDVLRLCETEFQAVQANAAHLLSPELSSSLMWLLRRLCVTYIVTNEAAYNELSLALSCAFGLDSEGGIWTLNYLLKTIEQTLRLRSGEPSLVEDTVLLLVSMAFYKERGQHLIKSDGLLELVKLQQSGHLGKLSSTAQRGLMQGLVVCASAINDSEALNEFWRHIFRPSVASFKQLVTSESFTLSYGEEETKKQVIIHFDNFIGAVQGCMMPTSHLLFMDLVDVLKDSVNLLSLYHNYSDIVELILELFYECGRRNASKQLYEISLELVSVYAKHNIGKRNVKSSQDDDQWRDLQLMMELLSSLLSKDFIDFAPFTHGDEVEVVAAADICLYALNIIMPLMSEDLLRLPSLCTPYFQMITYIAEMYPNKISQLPDDLMKNLLGSIELGLTTFGQDVGTLSFDFLVVLGSYVCKNCSSDTTIYLSLRPFLKLALDLILSQQINTDLLQVASATLYTLICCFQAEYKELVEILLQNHVDDSSRQRLADAFTDLTTNVQLTADKLNRVRFRDNFEKFIVNVRGFLFVK